jgi:hypothetical protein
MQQNNNNTTIKQKIIKMYYMYLYSMPTILRIVSALILICLLGVIYFSQLANIFQGQDGGSLISVPTKTITTIFPDPDSTNTNNNNNNNNNAGESFLAQFSSSDSYASLTRLEKTQCPSTTTRVELLFPHVNKAGGRTIEGTFSALVTSSKEYGEFLEQSDSIRFSKLSTARRSRRDTLSFSLVDGHLDVDEIFGLTNCRLTGEGCLNTAQKCQRWIFMAREPIGRTLSAFYTVTGRKGDESAPPDVGQGGGIGLHFPCEKGSLAEKAMRNKSFTFEDFARLSPTQRKKCYPGAANLHTRYLDGEGGKNLDKALRRLSQMSFVGLAEHFGLSMQLLSFELNVDLERYFPVFNENIYSKNLSSQALQVLTEMNKLDLQIYAVAQKMFWARVKLMRDSPQVWGGSFPWGEIWSRASYCDPHIVCWDKKDASIPAFDFDSADHSKLLKGGEKERVVCAPKRGCMLTSPQGQAPLLSTKSLSRSKCVASFFIVGARKGGTTSLYHYFASHPNVRGVLLDNGARSGETFFFENHNTKENMIRIRYDEVFYKDFRRTKTVFDPTRHLTGESSVGYGPACSVPQLLKETCGGEIYVFYLVRDPVERMLSQFLMRDRLGTLDKMHEIHNFDADSLMHLEHITNQVDEMNNVMSWLQDVIKKTRQNGSPWKLSDEENWASSSFSVPGSSTTSSSSTGKNSNVVHPPPCLYAHDYLNAVWSGMYVVHLMRWLRYFDPSRITVIQSEEFFRNPAPYVKNAYQKLGIDPSLIDIDHVVSQAFNSAPDSQQTHVNPQVLAKLKTFFKPFNEALQVLVGNQVMNMSLWE